MKKYTSVFMLYARGTLYRILILLLFSILIQGGFFIFQLHSNFAPSISGANTSGNFSSGEEFTIGLETVLDRSHAALIFGITFLILLLMLSLNGCEWNGKQSYTLRRLSIPESHIFLCQAAYHFCCLLIMWGAELLTMLLFCVVWLAKTATGNPIYGQTIFLACYRSAFLHSLLPLADISRLCRNLLAALSLSLSTAYFPYCQRHGRFAVSLLLNAGITVTFFCGEMGYLQNDLLMILAGLAIAVHNVIYVFGEASETDSAMTPKG